MLQFTPSQIINGYQVFGDDKNPNQFYVMPTDPSFRVSPTNSNDIMFNFIEYQMPVTQPGAPAPAAGSTSSGNASPVAGGGFLIFDTVFAIPSSDMNAIQAALTKRLNAGGGSSARTAIVGIPSFIPDTTDPKNPSPNATLNILDGSSSLAGSSGGNLVQAISSVDRPSLFGDLTCAFTAQLTPAGAAVVKSTLPQKGGVIQVFYNLNFMASLPAIKARVWFDADKFASFSQSISKTGGSWDSGPNTENESMREAFISAECGGTDLDFTSLAADPNAAQIEASITGWAQQQIQAAIANVQAASNASSGSSSGSGSSDSAAGAPSGGSGSGSGGGGSSGGVTGQNTGSDLGSDRGSDGMNNVTRNETSFSSFSFDQTYTEKLGYSFPVTLQGTLPSIPNIAQYTEQVNADDPFFTRIYGNVQINADFAKYGIQSVVVSLSYGPPAGAKPVASHAFTTTGDIFDWVSNTVNGNLNYNYSYTVNYLDQSSAYSSALVSTGNSTLVINGADLNVLYIDFEVLNVDFTKVSSILLEVKYPDQDASGRVIDSSFSFNATALTASMVKILKTAFNKAYQYQLTYAMADGSQLVQGWVSSTSEQLFIKNPFVQQTFSFISEGDFTNEISNIFLKLTYVDAANNYSQSGDYTFSSANRSYDWTIPVVNGGQGVIHYSGVVSALNQTTQNIPDTTSTNTLITFGPPNQAIVTV
ncbi:MAG TPA: hypothetical protein VK914_10345, partial [bacterium]|nr:hypothetical protein [bacterium]